MKNIRFFLSENFPVLGVKFSVYLNRRVFVMTLTIACLHIAILTESSVVFFIFFKKIC